MHQCHKLVAHRILCNPFLALCPILVQEGRKSIHPLFRKSKFSKTVDYAILEPSLRLASQLLRSTPLVPYLNALVDGTIIDIEHWERSCLRQERCRPTAIIGSQYSPSQIKHSTIARPGVEQERFLHNWLEW